MLSSIVVYRIAEQKYVKDLSGVGAKIFGGRWNSAGYEALYTSSTISLALLEKLCYTPLNLIKNYYSIATIEINDVLIEEFKNYPKDWYLPENRFLTQQFGNNWLQNNKQHLLKVPSAVINKEFNFIINPNAKGLKIKIVDVEPLIIDTRLLK
ncbi:MAG: RES family NAD+ phosphorylase [Bacteroidia bacterium]